MPAPVVAAAAPAALPWLGGAIAAGGAVLGSVATGMFGNSQAKRQMEFQRDMANTAHQREMGDLRRAGLNPLLSARHGGASAPAGASAQSPDFANSVNSALAATRLKMDAQMQAAQIKDVNSASALKDAQTNDVNSTQADRIDLLIAQKQKTLQDEKIGFQEAKKVRAELDVLRAQRDNIRANTASTVADSEKKKLLSVPYKAANKAIDWTREAAPRALERMKRFRKEWIPRNEERR